MQGESNAEELLKPGPKSGRVPQLTGEEKIHWDEEETRGPSKGKNFSDNRN